MKKIYKKIPRFKVGDKYIHYTKYGGVNIGVIADIIETKCSRYTNGRHYFYSSWSIKNEIGIIINIDGSDGQFFKLEN